jgi:hypothetical protein
MNQEKNNSNQSVKLWLNRLALITIVFFLTMPPFIFFYSALPPLYLPFFKEIRVDHIIIFIVVYSIVYYLAHRVKKYLYLSIAIGTAALIISGLLGFYSFSDLYKSYKSFLYNIEAGAIKFEFEQTSAENFPNADKMIAAIDYRNPIVRNYAATIAIKHFEAYEKGTNRIIVQFFSVFKEIRNRWRYVYDPMGNEYFALASETIQQLQLDGKFKGDCDDYSILMAACIKAIGGEVKLVRTHVLTDYGATVGHVYPEVKVGSVKNIENINYLIREVLFPLENKDEPIYYHIDKDDNVWLNFDYNDYYPGGKYQSKIRKAELYIK